jgi:hypothetical protein
VKHPQSKRYQDNAIKNGFLHILGFNNAPDEYKGHKGTDDMVNDHDDQIDGCHFIFSFFKFILPLPVKGTTNPPGSSRAC